MSGNRTHAGQVPALYSTARKAALIYVCFKLTILLPQHCSKCAVTLYISIIIPSTRLTVSNEVFQGFIGSIHQF